MNSRDLYLYFSQRGGNCSSKNMIKDLVLFKKLLENYTYYTIMQAMDRYLTNGTYKSKTVGYFYSIFPKKMKHFAKLDRVNKYIRFLPFYDENIKSHVNKLVSEYQDYAFAEILSADEILRKKEIEKELEQVTKSYFEANLIQQHLL